MPPRLRKGLSLLEVLIALTILTISFLFLLGAFPLSFRGLSDAQNIYYATQISRAELEYARSKGYVWLMGPHNPSDLSGNITINQTQNGGNKSVTFAWQMVPSIAPSPAPSTGGVAQVDLFVSWKQAAGVGGYTDNVRESTWVSK